MDDAGDGGALDYGVVDKRAILDAHAQARGAVVQGVNVVLAAEAFDDARGIGCGLVIAADGIRRVVGFILAAARGLEVEPADEEVEDDEVEEEEAHAHHHQHVPLVGQRVLGGEQHIHETGGETEAGGPLHGGGDEDGQAHQ